MTTNEKINHSIFAITKQGGPRIAGGQIIAAGESVVAIELNMHSKRCELHAFTETEEGKPVIFIDSGPNGLYLVEGKEKEITEITFDFANWRLFCAEISRYTLRAVLIKYEKN